MGKVSENHVVMDQLRNNSTQQAMLGQFPASINAAVIDSREIHEKMALKVLSSDIIAKGFSDLVLHMLIKRLGKSEDRAQ